MEGKEGDMMLDERDEKIAALEARIASLEQHLEDWRSEDMRIIGRKRQHKLFHQQLFNVVSRAEIEKMVQDAIVETANRRLNLEFIAGRIERSTDRIVREYASAVMDRVAIKIAARFTVAPVDGEPKSKGE